MKPILEIQNLWKAYKIGGQQEKYLSLRDSLSKGLKFKSVKKDSFWALKDLSFNVYPGESLGIIGPNGAGKSTLLKVLSKITPPTKGKVIARGRVASLLEVGTGFHPELTGRENIYLNGSILGLRRAEIKLKFDEIVDFSGVEKFLDTPLKHYSSGMQLRLAFAVAAHLEPEILVIDEVLAVGDAEFQKKCLGKMEEVSKGGRTVLFVSHNMQALKNLCSRAAWIHEGDLLKLGNTEMIVEDYMNKSVKTSSFREWDIKSAPGNESVKLVYSSVSSISDEHVINEGDPLKFTFKIKYLKKDPIDLDVAFHLKNEEGIFVFVGFSAFTLNKEQLEQGFFEFTGVYNDCQLIYGRYTLDKVLIVANRGTTLLEVKNANSFEILPSNRSFIGWQGRKEGILRPSIDWKMNRIA